MVVKLFNDRSFTVISSAMVTFHQMCVSKRPATESEEDSFKLLHPYFRRIITVLKGLDSYGQTYGCDVLLRYAKLYFPRTRGR